MVCLVDGPLKADLLKRVAAGLQDDLNCGGHSLFMGMVRADEAGGRKVKAIEYSAHTPLVEKTVAGIVSEMKAKYNEVRAITILHSTGIVEAGELSLLVAVSAGHRKQAMEACANTVELVKERLPVWKKEIYSDNTHSWRENEPL